MIKKEYGVEVYFCCFGMFLSKDETSNNMVSFTIGAQKVVIAVTEKFLKVLGEEVNSSKDDKCAIKALKAFVLHELGHHYHGHTTKRLAYTTLLNTVTFYGAYKMGSFLSGLVAKVITHTLWSGYESSYPAVIIKAGVLMGVLSGVQQLNALARAALGRRQEWQADDFLVKQGDDKDIKAFKNHLKYNPDAQPTITNSWFCDHPSDEKRVAFFQCELEKLKQSVVNK